MDNRLVAAKVLRTVLRGGSLDRELESQLQRTPADSSATVQALVYGVLRQLELIETVLSELMHKPMKEKDAIVIDLLSIGVFELMDEHRPPHAVINGIVNLVKKQRAWAAGMSNGILRGFDRDKAAILATARTESEAKYLLPEWMIQQLQQDWPEQWQGVASESNSQPPMALRVNLAATTRDDYLLSLKDKGIEAEAHPLVESAIVLAAPCPVEILPGFFKGRSTVQDAAAQLSAWLLDVKPEQRVLDACAAPGGKTTHIHEMAMGKAAITALEISEARTTRLRENLKRSGCKAKIVNADAADTDSWWGGVAFDRILLDVPCSATGVIRRHPDIKHHRTPEDIEALVETQQNILRKVWKTLAPGGIILYSTCSMFRAENTDNIARFCADHPDASVLPLTADWGIECEYGRQILPGDAGMDGFFYAVLSKA